MTRIETSAFLLLSCSDDIRDVFEVGNVLFAVQRDCHATFSTRTACATDAMDVCCAGSWDVVVDYTVHAAEVDSTGEEVCSDEDPRFRLCGNRS